MDFSEKLKELHKLRQEKGEAAFEEAIRSYASEVVEGNGGIDFSGAIGEMLQGFTKDREEYEKAAKARAEAQDKRAEEMRSWGTGFGGSQEFLGAIKQSLPAMRSQAQFNVFMAGFDAFRGVLNSIFAKDPRAEADFLAALHKSFEVARQTTDLTERLTEVPEAAGSKLADEYREPPRQFGEYDVQRALLTELEGLSDLGALTRWWAENRKRIDDVVSPSLRNPLIDAVREKKSKLGEGKNA